MPALRIVATTLFVALALPCQAADWPQFRGDASRSGHTAETLPQSLCCHWSRQDRHGPAPAWPTRNRLRFDRAFQPIVAGGVLCYDSSADDTVYGLDAASGKLLWTFTTDGPVRFAPAAWRDRLFVASDDGHLYCLSVRTGELVWKRRGGPRDERLLGNDRMISRWPARGGPVVVDDMVYFGAGIWPSEGIYLLALNAETGNVLWQNDSSGAIEMDQPHATARAKSGLAAQGYLAAAGDALLVPTGRAVPAVLDRDNGTLRQFPLQAHQHAGGADVVLLGDWYVNSGRVYSVDGGSQLGSVGLATAVTPDSLLYAADGKLTALDRKSLAVRREVTDRKGKKRQVLQLAPPVWEAPVEFDAEPAPPTPKELQPPAVRVDVTSWTSPSLEDQAAALIVAGETAIVGGRGRVSAVYLPTRTVTWSAPVTGLANGLAVADGRLYASTDRGFLYCFGEPRDAAPTEFRPGPPETLPESSPLAREAVDALLKQTNITDGYCVDLGCADGDLTLELLRRTNLRIYAVDQDAAKVQRLRDVLHRTGLYGSRVTVHCVDPAHVPCADYCADLVVSGRSLEEEASEAVLAQARRLCRPCGGTLALRRADRIKLWTRDALPDSGVWTHQNSSAANTLCSDERRVRGPLEMLWYRDTDFVQANRHGRAPTILVQDGRMFVPGLNGLRAQSLYNGRLLWQFDLPGLLASYHREHSIGAAWTGGNVCLGPERVYLHNGKACQVLDASTGRQLAEWKTPRHPDGGPATWGYLAYHDGVLLGSLAREDYLIKCWSDRWDTGEQFTESTALFALDAETGKLLWTFQPKHSIRHNAIAMGGRRVYLVDRPVAEEDRLGFVASPSSAEQRRGLSPKSLPEPAATHPLGRLVALDLSTGRPCWEADKEIFGTLLMHSAEHGILWMGYQAAHQASRDSELGNRMAAFNPGDGTRLWDVAADYVDRPVLNGRTVYAPPGAWDLLTGEQQPFALQRSYGCGIVSGCRTMLVFRSATLGYVDLAVSSETQNYGGIRPGCWIAAIPAGGVVLMPDAASWCTCSYLNQGTIVLKGPSDD